MLCFISGPGGNILEPSAKQCHRLFLENPILSLSDLEVCVHLDGGIFVYTVGS